MRSSSRLATAVAVSVAAAVSAQQPSLTFEVASVKPSPDMRSVNIVRPSGGRSEAGGMWVASFASLEQILRAVYPGHDAPGQIVGGPSWVRTRQWEINAKTGPDRSNGERLAMARALLAERFQVSLHVETREMPAYRLTLARQDGTLGPGLRVPTIDCDEYRAAQQRGASLPPPPIQDRLPCAAVIMNSNLSPRLLRLTAGGTPVSGITALIANAVGRPVVDATALTRPFDVELEFSGRPLSVDPSAAAGDDGPSMFEAIQTQLGLRLESGQAPVDVLVIDRAELPTPD